MRFFSIGLLCVLCFFGCKTKQQTTTSTTVNFNLKFIGEQVIKDNLVYKNNLVGGLSSLDYANGKYYAICDDKDTIRFYTLKLDFEDGSFKRCTILDATNIIINEKVDPEGLRYEARNNSIYWTSEGSIRNNISPSIFKMDTLGNILQKVPTPKMFRAENGLRNNGTFEGISLSKDVDFLWIGMELPLKQDGDEPKLIDGKYPVRVSKINKKTGDIAFQFAYMLDKIPKDSKPSGKFRVNGSPEILSIDETHFLVLERAYASGYENGGNTVKIYAVDCSKATNIANVNSLLKTEFIPAKKTLIFDFESIRSKLTNGIVDNIEGITFGPTLANGNRTLLVVSDDNFRKFSKQITQIIAFEVIQD